MNASDGKAQISGNDVHHTNGLLADYSEFIVYYSVLYDTYGLMFSLICVY